MERQEAVRVLVTGLVLGITAAVVVWFLERFETNRLVDQLREDLNTWGKRIQPGGADGQ